MNRYSLFIALPLLTLQTANATSSTYTLTEERPQWALQVTPFLWASSLSGKISPFQRGSTVEVDRSFSEIMNNLNLGGFVNIWARNDRFVFSGNMMYSDTTDSRKNGPLPAVQIPNFGIEIPLGSQVDGKVDTKQFMATMMGGYRIKDTGAYTLDVLTGIRFWHINNEATVTARHSEIGHHRISYSEKFSWIDPLIGSRIFVPITETFSFQSEADMGGFNVGSHFTWTLLASVNYSFTNNLTVSGGYKALKVNYNHHGNIYDIVQKGPVLGMTWRF